MYFPDSLDIIDLGGGQAVSVLLAQLRLLSKYFRACSMILGWGRAVGQVAQCTWDLHLAKSISLYGTFSLPCD